MEEIGTNTALLIIDVQRDLFEKSTPVYRGDLLLKNINALVDRAHAAGAPVFYVQHSTKTTLIQGSRGWQLHPALKPRKTDHFIRKHHGNAFEDTPLKIELDALHVSKVVVVGLGHGRLRAGNLQRCPCPGLWRDLGGGCPQYQ
ncbi:MAG: isochorismatase family protein [Patescibacteria group bacterium]